MTNSSSKQQQQQQQQYRNAQNSSSSSSSSGSSTLYANKYMPSIMYQVLELLSCEAHMVPNKKKSEKKMGHEKNVFAGF